MTDLSVNLHVRDECVTIVLQLLYSTVRYCYKSTVNIQQFITVHVHATRVNRQA